MMMAAALAVAAPLVLAGEKDFLHFPSAEDVRLHKITRTGSEQEWPFSVEEGYLACVWSAGDKVVMFIEGRDEPDDDFEPRQVFVSVNPFELTLLNIAGRDLLKPAESVEVLIRRMGPFSVLGRRLCDQPPGASLGNSEL
jgi:hypothetical protein